jgi:NADPH-dependent curcumin reductase CurA
MSIDPYMLGRMQGSLTYMAPFGIDTVMDGEAIGIITKSRNPEFPEGTYVKHWFGWREGFVGDGKGLRQFRRVDGIPLEAHLDILGESTGLAAYAGLFYVANLQPRETVFVSGGAGAVGSVACQIALALDCHVVASAGSAAKIRWLEQDLGVHAAINYREHPTTESFEKALRAACPNGIDVYFENVGGRQLEAALWLMNKYGRIPLCGMIEHYESDYNNDRSINTGPRNFIQIADRWLKVQGFHCPHYFDRIPEFESRMIGWITDGKIRSRATVLEGLPNAAEAMIGLFAGANIGKMLVRL